MGISRGPTPPLYRGEITPTTNFYESIYMGYNVIRKLIVFLLKASAQSLLPVCSLGFMQVFERDSFFIRCLSLPISFNVDFLASGNLLTFGILSTFASNCLSNKLIPFTAMWPTSSKPTICFRGSLSFTFCSTVEFPPGSSICGRITLTIFNVSSSIEGAPALQSTAQQISLRDARFHAWRCHAYTGSGTFGNITESHGLLPFQTLSALPMRLIFSIAVGLLLWTFALSWICSSTIGSFMPGLLQLPADVSLKVWGLRLV